MQKLTRIFSEIEPLKFHLLLLLLLFSTKATAIANDINNEEPQFEITNIRIVGHDDRVCLDEDRKYELAFDVEGEVPEDVQFTAFHRHSWMTFVENRLDTIPYNERSFTDQFTDLGFPSSPTINHLFIVAAINGGDTLLTSSRSFEVVQKVDVENAGFTHPEVDFEISQDTIFDFTIVVDGGRGGVGHFFKIVHEESGEDFTDWQMISDPPHIQHFTMDVSEPGTYRLIGRSLCEDSVVTDGYFTITRTDEPPLPDLQITNLHIPSANDFACLIDGPLELGFDVEGDVSGDITFTGVHEIQFVGSHETTLGPIESHERRFPLEFPSTAPSAPLGYNIFTVRAIHPEEGIIAETIDTLDIVTPVAPEQASLAPDGIIEISQDTTIDIGFTYNIAGHLYKIVHEETGEDLIEWSYTLDEPIWHWDFPISKAGSYRLILGSLCEDSIVTDEYFTIVRKDPDPKPVDLIVRDEDGNFLQPGDDGRFVVCPGKRVTLRVPNKENATYYWYKDGNHLDNINERAYSIGIFESDRLGSGDYHVRIEVDGKVYVSEPVTVIFEEPNVYVLTEDNVLTASEGISYQWYRNGERLDGETNRSMTAEASGMYSVKIEVMAGCKIMSDEHEVIITSVNAEEMDSGFKVYPNPVNAEATLEVNSSYNGPVQIKVLDVTGGEHLSFEAEKTGNVFTYNVNLSGLSNGIYFVQVLEKENISVLKIIKN
ncbi:T9SS type A sorting domain-containing protein [Cytophagaceae bacterium ABcell3]|nr:T9SS type A sorting domain-containing protein [Cytophagaceae bacterium ABcell3]